MYRGIVDIDKLHLCSDKIHVGQDKTGLCSTQCKETDIGLKVLLGNQIEDVKYFYSTVPPPHFRYWKVLEIIYFRQCI